jgi:hypothetical protein
MSFTEPKESGAVLPQMSSATDKTGLTTGGLGSDKTIPANMQSGMTGGSRPRDAAADTPSMFVPGTVGKAADNSDVSKGGIMAGKTHGEVRGPYA